MIRKLATATIVGTLLLTGCAGTEGTVNEDPPAGTNADPADSESEEAPEEEGGDEPGQLAFGQAYTYNDGLTVRVSKPRPFKPSEYAAAEPGPARAFTITLVNKTGKPFDAGMVFITLQSGNTEANEIFDSEKGIEGSPSTKVLDGREAKWDVAYNTKVPADLVMEVQPDAGLEYASVIYVSQ